MNCPYCNEKMSEGIIQSPYYEPVDYSKECLVFSVIFPARPTFTNASDIKTFITDNNKFEPEYINHGSMGISNGIYAQNVDGIEHCFVNIVKISKKYIPKNVKNIYHATLNYAKAKHKVKISTPISTERTYRK